VCHRRDNVSHYCSQRAGYFFPAQTCGKRLLYLCKSCLRILDTARILNWISPVVTLSIVLVTSNSTFSYPGTTSSYTLKCAHPNPYNQRACSMTSSRNSIILLFVCLKKSILNLRRLPDWTYSNKN
jgi:hypothetical protein